MSKTVSVPDKYSQEDVARALKALERQKAQQAKWREKAKSPEHKAKQAESNLRRRVAQQLMLLKAKEKGITVTRDEIEKHLAAKAATPITSARK